MELKKVELVQQMQTLIQLYINDEGFSLETIYAAVGYSKRHADRVFQELLHKTPEEYVRAVRLTQSAKRIAEEERDILDIALDTHYNSHEAYTRAFHRQFGIAPSAYRKEKAPIPLFLQYPIRHSYFYHKHKESSTMKQDFAACTVTTTALSRPERNLILLYAEHAKDYWSFCEEKGCEWEGLLGSIQCKLDAPSILELPAFLQKQGKSPIAAGIEVPAEYDGAIPQGYEIKKLSACDMMVFQSEPYENEEDFCTAIETVSAAIGRYRPERYGYRFALELAPKFNFGASQETGAKMAIPVQRV